MNNKEYLGGVNYCHETFKLKDGPFSFMAIDHMKYLMEKSNLHEIHHIAVDGLAELLRERINTFNEQQFCEWLRFHLYSCEKKELMGYSNHIVFVAEK